MVDKYFIKDVVYNYSWSIVSANMPTLLWFRKNTQVTKPQKRKNEIEAQISILNILQKRKTKNGNDRIPLSKVVGKRKPKTKVGIPISM